jgi:signal transduction histidine kinase
MRRTTSLELEPVARHPRWWERGLVVALVFLVLGPFVLYAWVASGTAREIRRRDALERNQAAAELASRLVDARFAAVLDTLHSLARDPVLAAGLRRLRHDGIGHPDVAQRLRRLVATRDPDFLRVAIHRTNGALASSYPRASADRAAADASWRWLAEAGTPRAGTVGGLGVRLRAGQPAISDADCRPAIPRAPVVHLAVAVKPNGRLAGYITATYRIEAIFQELQPLRIGGGALLYVVDAAGQIVAAPEPSERCRKGLEAYLPLRRALRGELGAATATGLDGQREAFVGYAPARVPGWGVIAVQPAAAALAPVSYIQRRLRLLALPLLVLMVAAGWWMGRLHGRQVARSQDLADQNIALRAGDRSKSEFLANVSHDMRTPLASIKAAVSGLLEPDIDWDPRSLRGLLTLVNEEIDWLAARVRNLLDFTRIEANALLTEKTPCDLADIIDSALERVEPLTHGWRTEVDLPSEPLPVEADFVQIETVLLNLLENAVKYAPPRSTIRLRAGVSDDGRAITGSDRAGTSVSVPDRLPRWDAAVAMVTVEDQGLGVRPEEAERVFDPYYRGSAPHGSRGTGLGLAICKAIVEAHGGAIGVRRASGGGAAFWFTLTLLPRPALCREAARGEAHE